MRHYTKGQYGRTKTKRGLRRARRVAVANMGTLSMGLIPSHSITVEQIVNGECPVPYTPKEVAALRERLEQAAR